MKETLVKTDNMQSVKNDEILVQVYSSNKIRKAQNEHLKIFFQNLNKSVVVKLTQIT